MSLARVIGELIPVFFFTMLVLVVYFTAKFKYATKKEILKHGGDLPVAQSRFPYWEIGLTIVGLGLGLGVGAALQSLALPEASRGMLIGASVLFFGGLGLIIATLTRNKIHGRIKEK